MAQRYVPKYIHTPGWGWYYPTDEAREVRHPQHHRHQQVGFGMALPPVSVKSTEEKLKQPGNYNPVPNPGPHPLQPLHSPQPSSPPPPQQQPPAAQQPPHETSNPPPPAKEPFPARRFKIFGFLLSMMSSASISFGLTNVIITALVITVPKGTWGCLAEDPTTFNSIGPSSSAMEFIDWVWISAGIWASITVFIAANIIGSIKDPVSKKANVFAIFGVLSLGLFLPAALIFGILDIVMSTSCKDPAGDEAYKFWMPVLVTALSVLEFLLTIYIFKNLRSEIQKAPPSLEASTEATPTPTPTDTPLPAETPSHAVTPLPRPPATIPVFIPKPVMPPAAYRQPYPPQRPYGYAPPAVRPPIRRRPMDLAPKYYPPHPRAPPVRPHPVGPPPLVRPKRNFAPLYSANRSAFRSTPPRYYPSSNDYDYKDPNLGLNNRNSGIFSNSFLNDQMFPSMAGASCGPNLAYKYYP